MKQLNNPFPPFPSSFGKGQIEAKRRRERNKKTKVTRTPTKEEAPKRRSDTSLPLSRQRDSKISCMTPFGQFASCWFYTNLAYWSSYLQTQCTDQAEIPFLLSVSSSRTLRANESQTRLNSRITQEKGLQFSSIEHQRESKPPQKGEKK